MYKTAPPFPHLISCSLAKPFVSPNLPLVSSKVKSFTILRNISELSLVTKELITKLESILTYKMAPLYYSSVSSFSTFTGSTSNSKVLNCKEISLLQLNMNSFYKFMTISIICSILNRVKAAINQTHNFAFRHVGFTAHALSYANVQVKLDLKPMAQDIDDLHKAVKDSFTQYQKKYASHFANAKHDETLVRFGAVMDRISKAKRRVDFYINVKRKVFNLPRQRRKRFLVTLIAVAITLATASTVLGIYNTVELSNMSSDNTAQVKATEVIGAQTQQNAKTLGQVSNITRTLEKYNQVQDYHLLVEYMLSSITQPLAHLEGELGDVAAIVTSLSQQKASPALLEKINIDKLANQVQDQAATQGYQVLLNHALDLAQCSTSFVTTEEGYTIFIHVPVARPDTILNVYQILNLPIPATNNLHLAVDSAYDIVATNNDRSLVQTMTSSELAACDELGPMFLCQNNNVARKPDFNLDHKDDTMCMLAMLTQRHKDMVKLCNWKVNKVTNSAVQVSDRVFVTFNKEPTEARMFCTKDNKPAPRTTTLQGSTTIRVEANCQLETNQFIMFGADEIHVREFEVAYAWPHPVHTIVGDDLDFQKLEEALDDIHIFAPNQTSLSIPEAIKKLKEHHEKNQNFLFSLFASITSILSPTMIVAGLVIYCCCCSSARLSPVMSVPPLPAPRLAQAKPSNHNTNITFINNDAGHDTMKNKLFNSS